MLRIVSCAVAGLMTTAGCTRIDAIKPTELPKLNGSTVQDLGSVQTASANVRFIGISVSTVEGVDGRTIEVKGKFNATVVEEAGKASRFEHPVMSMLVDPDRLTVKGSNRGEGTFDLAKVTRVDVETYDPAKSMLVYLAIMVPVVVIGSYVVWSKLREPL